MPKQHIIGSIIRRMIQPAMGVSRMSVLLSSTVPDVILNVSSDKFKNLIVTQYYQQQL